MKRPMRIAVPTLVAAAAAALAAAPMPALALSFEVGETTINVDNLITIGALMRMQDRDDALVGKSNLNPGICVRRVSEPFDPNGNNVYAGDTCSATVASPGAPGFGTANDRYVAQPGNYSPNGDNGNLNFEQYDIVHAVAKMTSDISFDFNVGEIGFNVFVRPIVFFDNQYVNLEETHPDTTSQFATSDYPDSAIDENGKGFEVLDAFVSTSLPFFGGRELQVKVGKQVINWGESSFLALNSLNFISPPNQAKLRFPGFDVKELFQPVGMVYLSTDVMENVGVEMFYQYDWQPIIADPVGSFFSSSDIVGPGGFMAMLSFGKAPEDPLGVYEPWRNPDDPAGLTGSTSSRTVYRDFEAERAALPDDGGQYGMALKMFLEDFNNGTEVGLYFANYHSRVPSISGFAADATCVGSGRGGAPGQGLINQLLGTLQGLLGPQVPVAAAQNLASLLLDCEMPPTNLLAAAGAPGVALMPHPEGVPDALPVDSARLMVEYPENIRLYGVSFNTTIGDFAFSGEYAYRENLPIQLHSTDLLFALLQPAFPANDINLAIATLPGRRTGAPDFISQYREPGCANDCIDPNEYVRGFERMKIGQLNLTLLKTIGGDNPIGATQMTLLLETGMTNVFDMPGLDELQFNGAGTDTHISNGADGSTGINPPDVVDDPAQDPARAELRQNPTAHNDRGGFGTELSYGYRFINLNRYDNAVFGVNLETLLGFFHDVEGVAPGLGQNFVEGRKQILAGLRWDYLSTWTGEIRYTWFTGGKFRDGTRDRDNLLLWVGYQF